MKGPAYYNEHDPRAAAWLRELIRAGLIPPGDVDERSITDVRADDVAGYRQCHFFAGVGGWALAARLAGWPDDRELWTGSPPCQPFSVAGRQRGTDDPRHLWPDFFRLIRAARPACVFGEQVAAAVGKDWFVGVRSDLESAGYDGRGFVVPACAVNAPHRRDRLWFVARRGDVDHAERARLEGHAGHGDDAAGWAQPNRPVAETGGGLLEHAESVGRREGRAEPEFRSGRAAAAGAGVSGGDVVDCDGAGCESRCRDDSPARHGNSVAAARGAGHWHDARWLIGHDGKARRVEPGIPLLVDGLPNRTHLLRGYGNAIVPQVAAEILGAYLDEYGD